MVQKSEEPAGEDASDPRPDPPNAFGAEFLHGLDLLDDEPETATEADTAALWRTVRDGGRFAVLRHHESLREGDRPPARGLDRYTALLVAAVLPAVGRTPTWRLGKEAREDGFPLASHGEEAGFLAHFDEPLLAALNLADALARSPQSLALLLQAAGGLALRQVGRILAHAFGKDRHGG